MSCQMIRADDWDRMVKAQTERRAGVPSWELPTLSAFEPQWHGAEIRLAGETVDGLTVLLADALGAVDQLTVLIGQIRTELVERRPAAVA